MNESELRAIRALPAGRSAAVARAVAAPLPKRRMNGFHWGYEWHQLFRFYGFAWGGFCCGYWRYVGRR